MAITFSIEYDDVKTIIESGPGDASWVRDELRGVDLSDKRLNNRLVKVTGAMAKSPLSPINEACGDWASTQAAYRLFNNPKADPEKILRPHQNATVKRMNSYGGTVLAVQDTVFFSYGKHPKTRGLGPIGKGESTSDRGLVAHHAVAFTTSGVPLGILSQRIWARQEVLEESRTEKIERLQCTPTEEKESSKWLLAMDEASSLAPPHLRVVNVCDRESDFFEFMHQAMNGDRRALFLLRAKTDRKLVPEDSEGFSYIAEALAVAPVSGTLTVQIPGNGKRKARDAIIELRYAEVTLQPPTRRRDAAKPDEPLKPIQVSVVCAREPAPPEGVEAISWILLTNVAVTNHKGAVERVEWYCKRWGIELWHKVLKSGCKVEECLLETAERLSRFLALFSIIGCRILYITYLARVNPDAKATSAFSEEELQALHIRVTKSRPEKIEAITLQEAVRMIGSLGGHLGRKSDGNPGITTIWRGMMRLYEDVEMLRAFNTALLDSS